MNDKIEEGAAQKNEQRAKIVRLTEGHEHDAKDERAQEELDGHARASRVAEVAACDHSLGSRHVPLDGLLTDLACGGVRLGAKREYVAEHA